MTTLLIGPRFLPTDAMIQLGSQFLFQMAGVAINAYRLLNDHFEEEIEIPFAPDRIIILGTPWVWDECHKSFKYTNLLKLFNRFPQAKRLFFGVGSCFPLDDIEVAGRLKESKDELAKWFDGATIVTRDSLAQEVLKDFNSTLLPCPAFYGNLPIWDFLMARKPEKSETEGNLMFWYDPTKGVSQSTFVKSQFLDEYITKFQTEFKDRKPKVFCVHHNELELAEKIGLGTPEIIYGTPRIGIPMQNAARIFSGRVHLAVPNYIFGKDVELIPVDSRARTYHDVKDGLIADPINSIPAHMELLRAFADVQ